MLATFLCTFAYLLISRKRRPSAKIDIKAPRFAVPTWKTFTHTARDGVNLKISVSEQPCGNKQPEKVMLLAEPLGQCGPSIYNPICTWFGPEYTYVTWDYRGFFDSDSPKRIRSISVREHAYDAVEVLRAAGYENADVMVGHSMGAAVCLETALLFPECINSIILLNGFHGDVFQTAFQPMYRIPFMGDLIEVLLDFILMNTHILKTFNEKCKPFMECVLPIYARLFGSPYMQKLAGDSYLFDFMTNYTGHIYNDERNCQNWLRLFQELDAHSVYHLLPQLEHPTLVISGFLDVLTPALQSAQIAARMPNAIHYCDPFSSHATILESPEWCLAEIEVFLLVQSSWKRKSSTIFSVSPRPAPVKQ